MALLSSPPLWPASGSSNSRIQAKSGFVSQVAVQDDPGRCDAVGQRSGFFNHDISRQNNGMAQAILRKTFGECLDKRDTLASQRFRIGNDDIVIDRLVEMSDGYWVLDYKSGRLTEELLEGYRRQMESYRAAVIGIFPGRPVHCRLVFGAGESLVI